MTLPVQLCTLREFCPVCDGRGLVRARATDDGAKACIACPHCTDPTQLLNLVEVHRAESA